MNTGQFILLLLLCAFPQGAAENLRAKVKALLAKSAEGQLIHHYH